MLAQVRNPLQVTNHHKTSKDPEISIESFKRTYPSAILHPDPINVTASVHCELTVAMHRIKSSVENSAPIEIGVSKHSCYLCGKLIRKINKHFRMKFVVSGLQGKTHAGWRFPLETPLDLQRAIMKALNKEIVELRHFAYSKRRSDSFPTADSGDEARANDRKIGLCVADVFSIDTY